MKHTCICLFSFCSVQRIVLQLSRDFNVDYHDDEIELIYIYISIQYIYVYIVSIYTYWLKTLSSNFLFYKIIYAYSTRNYKFCKKCNSFLNRSNAFRLEIVLVVVKSERKLTFFSPIVGLRLMLDSIRSLLKRVEQKWRIIGRKNPLYKIFS